MSGPAARVAAYFDVDGTIAASNIVRSYVDYRTRDLGPARAALWKIGYLPAVGRWVLLDRVDRARMNVEFYRSSYRGRRRAEVERAFAELYPRRMGASVFPAARARIAEHRARGERVVLLTGSLDLVVAPLARELGADDLIAVRLLERDGVFTGELAGRPLSHEEKRRRLEEHAARSGVDLARSWAYGDSLSDLDVLAAVGRPVAVNPDRRLRREALARGWPVEEWRR